MENAEQWIKIKDLFDSALECPSSERGAFLSNACGADAELRAEIESLLQAYEKADNVSRPQWLQEGHEEVHEQKFIGAYRLEKKLGEGGMGQVWLADQTAPVRRQVALKLIRGGTFDRSALQRFQAERQSLAIMDHPSIAKVFDAGATPEGQPYFVMEYVPGAPITDYCDQKKLRIPERLELFVKVCEGVQHAHQKAIIHRDLKPANILVVEVDGRPLPRIIDFGLAKGATPEALGEAQFTLAGSFLGTPGYMSPEQADPGHQDVDTRTDVYSLGAILYVLLTGSLPFDTAQGRKQPLDEALRQLREDDPPLPSAKAGTGGESRSTAEARRTEPKQLVSLLRGDLDWIVMRALERDRGRRYVTPTELAADICRYLQNEPVLARPASLSYRVAKFVRRNRTAVALASLTFAALVVGATGTIIQSRTARRQRDFALHQLERAEAVNDLNSYVLSNAAPSGKLFTVGDLLARAEQIVRRQQGDNAIRAELLISIGRQYTVQDEYQKARGLLEDAYTLSRTLSEPTIRASASCGLGQVLSRTGETARAEELFQDGLKQLPNDPSYVVERVSCLLRGSEVASNSGRETDALSRAWAAEHLLEQSSFRSDSLRLGTLISLASVYDLAGQRGEANEAYLKATDELQKLGRGETQMAGILFNNWGTMLIRAGRPLDAERALHRTIEISRDGQTESTITPTTLSNYSAVLYELGRLDEASDYAARAYARANETGDNTTASQALFHRARIYRAQRNLPRANEMLSEVAPRLRQHLPRGHVAFAILALEQGLNAETKGDLPRALQLLDQSLSLMENSAAKGPGTTYYQGKTLVARSGIELELGRANEAVADASRALPMLEKACLPGGFSLDLGHAYLGLGRALHAQGKVGEAQAAFRSAAEHLGSALGHDNPESGAALRLTGQGLK